MLNPVNCTGHIPGVQWLCVVIGYNIGQNNQDLQTAIQLANRPPQIRKCVYDSGHQVYVDNLALFQENILQPAVKTRLVKQINAAVRQRQVKDPTQCTEPKKQKKEKVEEQGFGTLSLWEQKQ